MSITTLVMISAVALGGYGSGYRSELRVVSPQPVQQVVVQEYAPVQRVIVEQPDVNVVPDHCYVQQQVVQPVVVKQRAVVQQYVQQQAFVQQQVVKQRFVQSQKVQPVIQQNVYGKQRGGLFQGLFGRNRGGY